MKKQTKTQKAGSSRKTRKSKVPAPKAPRTKARDPRLPAPGTTIVRPYKGREIRVTVLDDGFRWEGKNYRSLSKLASEISEQPSVNGYLWFRLTERPVATSKAAAPKQKAKPAATDAAPESAPAAESAPA